MSICASLIGFLNIISGVVDDDEDDDDDDDDGVNLNYLARDDIDVSDSRVKKFFDEFSNRKKMKRMILILEKKARVTTSMKRKKKT